MSNLVLNSLIIHIIAELSDMGIGFGKTKLVKLIYLADVEYYRARRKTLTGMEWIFYHYGPYSSEIDDALAELAFDIPQESVQTAGGRAAIVFKTAGNLKSRLGEHVKISELRLVNRVIGDWGETELNPLLNHVYFYTEPMKDAARGETLDFSKIQRRPRRARAAAGAGMPEDRMNEYRKRFREAKAARAELRRPLDPPPRFDRVYREALARMNEDERYELPTGEVVVLRNAASPPALGGNAHLKALAAARTDAIMRP